MRIIDPLYFSPKNTKFVDITLFKNNFEQPMEENPARPLQGLAIGSLGSFELRERMQQLLLQYEHLVLLFFSSIQQILAKGFALPPHPTFPQNPPSQRPQKTSTGKKTSN